MGKFYDAWHPGYTLNPYDPGHTTHSLAAAVAKSLQSCPTLCDPTDSCSPGSPVPGIRQARTLEWVAISFSSAWKWKVKVKSLSCARLPATPWTVAYQAPPSMGFSRQEYRSGVPLPFPTHSLKRLHIRNGNWWPKWPPNPFKCQHLWSYLSQPASSSFTSCGPSPDASVGKMT